MAMQFPSISSQPSLWHRHQVFRSACHSKSINYDLTASRRSANYMPNIWDYDSIQLLRSDYQGEAYGRRAEKLKEEIGSLLIRDVGEPLTHLQLIDDAERLGLGHLFEIEIMEALNNIWVRNNMKGIEGDLHATALQFRLLRKHGFRVSQDVFKNFIDGRGSYIPSVSEDDWGMLSLYEASYHALQGETVLDEYRALTSSYLKVFKRKPDDQLAKMVEHSLELPLHWRMPRIEARWYLNVYETRKNMNPILLELAKLDFNMLQAIHQKDLRDASRWWRDLDLGRRLSFSRDRLVESFVVALGVIPEPQFGYGRVGLAKVCQFITTLDDIYDVYGLLDELECFTDAIDRWDVTSMDQLPEYMKICFLALYNTVNEMGFEILKEQGLDAIPYLRKVWADFCKSMLVESKWYHNGYRPSLQEYLDNSWVSSSAPVILVNALFLASREIRTEALDVIDESSNLLRWSSMIFRLCNDLGTCTKEEEIGDVSSAIQCYMNDAHVSEGIARDHIKDLIADAWKKLNKEVDSCSSPRSSHFTKIAFNLARVAHCIYQFGDGHSVQDEENKDRITSLLIKPLVINDMLS